MGNAAGANDPLLDELLAAWNDPGAPQAKLRILGPVTATAYGPSPARAESLCTEIVAYLWSRPGGVSTDQLAGDLWPHKNRSTRSDAHLKSTVSRVRQWLGADPTTGNAYVPRSRDRSHGYRLGGVLVDWELFCRLRTRGEARGADGLHDLIAALDLVAGRPWSQLRPCGYGWLRANEELLYRSALFDVAHLVASRGFEASNASAVVRACEIALQLGEPTEQGVS